MSNQEKESKLVRIHVRSFAYVSRFARPLSDSFGSALEKVLSEHEECCGNLKKKGKNNEERRYRKDK